jgi:hypothetical protein
MERGTIGHRTRSADPLSGQGRSGQLPGTLGCRSCKSLHCLVHCTALALSKAFKIGGGVAGRRASNPAPVQRLEIKVYLAPDQQMGDKARYRPAFRGINRPSAECRASDYLHPQWN